MNRGAALLALCVTGCYAGARAERDVNAAWRGRSRGEIEGRWGRPAATAHHPVGTELHWSHTRHNVQLPSGGGYLEVEPGRIEGAVAIDSGRVWTSTTEVQVLVDASGTIQGVQGPSLRWGAPDAANLRWGVVLGAHAGMGRLDDASTPLPGGGAYIGGMLGPTLGLVGCFSMASGKGDGGGAIDFAWGVAAQWWPMTRLWLRAGPALVLDLDPGFADAALAPGVTTGAGLAVVKVGSFVLDLRMDVTAATAGTFGTAGVGVNLN